MQERTAGSPGPVDNFLGQHLEIVAVVCLLVADDIHQSRPAAADADHLIAFAQGTNGDRSNGGIESWDIAAAG